MNARLKFAAWMMYGSAALHLAAPAVIGLTSGALLLAVIGAVWAVLAWRLVRRGSRGLTWLCFFLALGGMCVALSEPWGAPSWLASGFALFDALAAAGLFAVLWSDREGVAV
ncbi:hypothetical protein KO498_15665 [Lentibacter algarum]|uniref:hypothetical protein n=1 Tax=Lentibacter algarum TaxID=576131 RepID=UPI001C0A58FC|nr:hypothetical protein [Lentibacter algarum]MBU2983245.1 hypothetical protein [Lentibacter algarum]